MKNLFVLFAIAFSLLLVSSCCKDDNDIDTAPQVSQLQHLPLKTGNYWVYNTYEIDTLGNETVISTVDSTIISGDTIINGLTYYILKGNYAGGQTRILDILRDSSGYLVNNKGKIKFSEDNFTDTLSIRNTTFGDSTYATITYKMEKHNGPFTVPAGTFDDILNYKGSIKFYGANNPFYKDKNTFYSKDIGLILDTYYWISKARFYRYERRLVRYNVNN